MNERLDALEDALAELQVRCVPITSGAAPRPWRREFPLDAVSLHVPLEGRCHIDVDTPIWVHRLERGQVLLVNRGVAGALRPASESDPPPEVFSARIELEAPHGHPLLDAMPQLVQASPGDGAAPRSFGPLLEAFLVEFRMPVLGRGALAARLCEGLFIEALRSHLLDLSWADTGWFRVLADPVIKAQLGLPPSETGKVATVTNLAAAANRSPRRFGARFRQFAGFTPSDHVRHTRARRAARLLREGETDLARIAHVTGYRSRPSFCRAFKRELGVSPASYWRTVHGRRFPRQPDGPEKTRWDAEAEYGCPDMWELRFALEEEADEAGTRSASDRPGHPTEPE
jgi:AraC-like DNA-binding protein